MKIWSCKIGEVDESRVPSGGDGPMRRAVERAYFELTGVEPEFTFSGWGASLTEVERAVVEDRLPARTDPGTLSEIIRMATFPADLAALSGQHPTNARMVHAAVDAAIRAAVANGVLVVADHADALLAMGFEVSARAGGQND